jgi:hypothetical protein
VMSWNRSLTKTKFGSGRLVCRFTPFKEWALYHSRRQRQHDLNCFISEATMLSNSGKKLEIHRSVFFLDVFQNVKLLHYNPFEMTFCIFEDLGGSKYDQRIGDVAELMFRKVLQSSGCT